MKKGIESLRDAYERDVNGGDGYIKGEAPAKWQWIMARADMYARYCGVSREKILEAWEEDRRYWYMNYYQECNQPDLTKRENVMSIAQWKEKGKALFLLIMKGEFFAVIFSGKAFKSVIEIVIVYLREIIEGLVPDLFYPVSFFR